MVSPVTNNVCYHPSCLYPVPLLDLIPSLLCHHPRSMTRLPSTSCALTRDRRMHVTMFVLLAFPVPLKMRRNPRRSSRYISSHRQTDPRMVCLHRRTKKMSVGMEPLLVLLAKRNRQRRSSARRSLGSKMRGVASTSIEELAEGG